jgi:GNAT superfamily N-acetyltransferase
MSRGEVVRICLTKQERAGQMGNVSTYEVILTDDLVFIPVAMRGRGLGSRMMQMAEEEGRAWGLVNAVLYTISFQAPDFYAKHGWHEFGKVDCHLPGTSRVLPSPAKETAHG